MIFDNDTVTRLVEAWQEDQDADTLDTILELSQSLIEAIVSGFDYTMRDDLIQESRCKIIKALHVFDAQVATLHTYLTTVIRNCCISFVTKYSPDVIDLDDLDILGEEEQPADVLGDLLTDVVIYNRQRFPSLPVDALDDITILVYSKLRNGMIKAKAVTAVSDKLGYDRSIVASVANSTVLYLRWRYISRYVPKEFDGEFTLLPEVKMIIGEAAYKRFIKAFSGFTIRVP